jgi:hypothetical protein
VICKPCRAELHGKCPEADRQLDPELPLNERLASAWCDCQHEPRRTEPVTVTAELPGALDITGGGEARIEPGELTIGTRF